MTSIVDRRETDASGDQVSSPGAPDYKKSAFTGGLQTAPNIEPKISHMCHQEYTVVTLRMFESSVPQLFTFLRLS